MKFVKEKSSALLVGDKNVDRIVDGKTISYSSLTDGPFSYNEKLKKNVRLHSRKTKYILECLYLLNFEEIKKNFKSEEIGVYINASQNIFDFDVPALGNPKDKTIFQHYKENIPPTYNLKNITGIIPGHICIFHEIHGPSCALTSLGASQVFSRAELDLKMGNIKCAVVAIVNSYEDPYTLSLHHHLAEGKKICEAATVFLLTDETQSPKIQKDKKHFFGYLNGILKMDSI